MVSTQQSLVSGLSNMNDLSAQFDNESFRDIVGKAKDWVLLNGLTMRPENGAADHLEFIPFTLLPSSFPRKDYQELCSLQPVVNELYHKIAKDDTFLREALADVARADNFTARLLEIYEKCKAEGYAQTIELGLLRSDYMAQKGFEGSSCKQVEVNTIASGHGWIGTACSKLHCYILAELKFDNYIENLPPNNPIIGLCRGMVEAWRMYGEQSASILFVVEPTLTRNIADQRLHEYTIRELEQRCHVIRRNLGELAKSATLKDGASNRRLFVDDKEIAVAYFRSGYAPEQYATEAEWSARLMIERSKAIKCPSVAYQLAGTKKVQQVLAEPNVLETFLRKEQCKRLRRVFTGLYSLSSTDEMNDAVIEKALRYPDDYVLKPQREGGANNYFGDKLKAKLYRLKSSGERNAWILMDRIVPIAQKNYIVKPAGEVNRQIVDVTSELGIFGVVLGDNERIYINETAGHNLRSKLADCDEAGVSSGFGACSSPFLT